MDGFDFRNRSHSYLRVELSKNPSPKNPIMSERWRGGAAAAAFFFALFNPARETWSPLFLLKTEKQEQIKGLKP